MRLSVAQLPGAARRVGGVFNEPRRTTVPAAVSWAKSPTTSCPQDHRKLPPACFNGLLTSVAEALPDDPDLLKAMLLAERAEYEVAKRTETRASGGVIRATGLAHRGSCRFPGVDL
jgi:hypothetical protein